MDTRIQNVRLDATSNQQLMALADAGAAAFGHTATLQVEQALAQLLRLRVAQINNCSYCLLVHHAAARTAEIPPSKVETLTAWWETHLFTETGHMPQLERPTEFHNLVRPLLAKVAA